MFLWPVVFDFSCVVRNKLPTIKDHRQLSKCNKRVYKKNKTYYLNLIETIFFRVTRRIFLDTRKNEIFHFCCCWWSQKCVTNKKKNKERNKGEMGRVRRVAEAHRSVSSQRAKSSLRTRRRYKSLLWPAPSPFIFFFSPSRPVVVLFPPALFSFFLFPDYIIIIIIISSVVSVVSVVLLRFDSLLLIYSTGFDEEKHMPNALFLSLIHTTK